MNSSSGGSLELLNNAAMAADNTIVVTASSDVDKLVEARFPEKLYRLLEYAHEQNLTTIITWQPHGRCFCIHDRDQFIQRFQSR